MKKSILSLLLVIGSSAFAGVEQGVQAYDRGDLDIARQEFEQAISLGDAEAGFYLGHMFVEGHGVAKDMDKAIECFELAAERGDADAQFKLAQLYDEGKGALQDYTLAAKWYQAAAAQGTYDAQYRLGEMYESGLGVNYNPVYAHTLFNLASMSGEQNYVDARERLGEQLSVEQLNQAHQLASAWNEDKPFSLDIWKAQPRDQVGRFIATNH